MNFSTIKLPFIQLSTFLVLSFFTPFLQARDDTALLEELRYLQAEAAVTIASKIPTPEKQAPAILTIISEKEILNSGARDLIDVLRLVPGFDFGVDVLNIVGPSIRSNWAYEGGILILIDGVEMNERFYGTVQLGQHYPIDNIQKIEVMRGPGSVMYGGFARLGVINIITKGFKNIQNKMVKNTDEMAITARYGQMAQSNGHRGLSFYVGKNLTDDLRITFSAKGTQAHRSDRLYTDVQGDSVNLKNTNQLENTLFNLGFQYTKDLTMRFIFDDYNFESADGSLFINKTPSRSSYKAYLFNLKYQHDLTDALKLNINFNYSLQLPWISDGGYIISNTSSTRYLSKLRLDYKLNKTIQINSGLEFSHEEFDILGKKIYTAAPPIFPIYENFTPYFESLIKTDWGNLTLGLRYDKHNVFESNLAPRVALTNVFEKFHYKLLYSNSFRTPTIENTLLSSGDILRPERTKAYEIELGYQFNKSLSLTTNAFYFSSKDKLIFGFNGQGFFYYNAKNKIDSVGVETEWRWKPDWGYITFNHSYTQILSNVKDYQAINSSNGQVVDSNTPLAFPNHKFTFNTHYEITPFLSINPSLILTTSRYAYHRYDDLGNLVLQKYKPEVLGNIYFRYENALIKGLDLGIGVYNLFNSNQNFIQPYNSGHAPLPGPSREFIFKLSYQL